MMTEEEFRVKMKELDWPDTVLEKYIIAIKKAEELLDVEVPFEEYIYKYAQVVYDENKTFEP